MLVRETGGSLQDFIEAVRVAFEKQYPPVQKPEGYTEPRYWIRDTFEDHIVVEDGNQLYRVPMTVEDDEITFAPYPEWERVRLSYVREFTVGEFRGDFPEVPIAEGVDLDALKANDPEPFFVTLPIGRIGEISSNGLEYDEELVRSLVEQINAERPTGIMGHIPVEELDSAYPPPDVFWVGAVLEGTTAWAKGYVPPGEARETLRRLKAVGGKAATSIFGPPPARRVQLGDGRWRAEGFKLQSLDLAPYDRAALKLGGQFAVTSEMDRHNESDESEDTMRTREQIIAELTAADIPQALREQIINEWQAAGAHECQVAELQGQLQQRDARIQELEGVVERYQVAEFNAGLDALVAEFVKVEAKDDTGRARVEALRKNFRARIVAEIGEERDPAKVKACAQTLWDEEFKPLAEMLVSSLAGPAAVTGGMGNNWRDELAEQAPKLRKQYGV